MRPHLAKTYRVPSAIVTLPRSMALLKIALGSPARSRPSWLGPDGSNDTNSRMCGHSYGGCRGRSVSGLVDRSDADAIAAGSPIRVLHRRPVAVAAIAEAPERWACTRVNRERFSASLLIHGNHRLPGCRACSSAG
jgi:hypothetical protein